MTIGRKRRKEVKCLLEKQKILSKKKNLTFEIQTQMCLRILRQYGESIDLVATLQAQNQISESSLNKHNKL